MSRIRLCGDWCVYCGDPATTDEHFPPRSVMVGGFVLPCCFECNTIAGTVFPHDFYNRCGVVRNKLMTIYKKEINLPEWDGAAIAEMNGRLRRFVENGSREAKRQKNRIYWNIPSYIRKIDLGGVFNPFFGMKDAS